MSGKNGGNEDVKRFLCSALEAGRTLERQHERVEDLECRCERLTAPISETPRGGGGQGPERLWAALSDERAEELRLGRQAKARRAAVEGVIRALPDPEQRSVLRLRYLKGLTWPEVRRELARSGGAKSERGVYRLHSRALLAAGRAAGLL